MKLACVLVKLLFCKPMALEISIVLLEKCVGSVFGMAYP
jgi:hypothetical protein